MIHLKRMFIFIFYLQLPEKGVQIGLNARPSLALIGKVLLEMYLKIIARYMIVALGQGRGVHFYININLPSFW